MIRPAKIETYVETMSSLVKSVREFWFNNEPGEFYLGQRAVARDEIFTYGGPNPEFNVCHKCQEQEWLSRLEQKNLFSEHECAVYPGNNKKYCKFLCERQGDDNWTNYHQNFYFAVGCDKELQAPKCLLYLFKETAASIYDRFVGSSCDQWIINLRRQLAYSCQLEVVQTLEGIHQTHYDFIFLFNTGSTVPRFPRTLVPLVMIGNDPVGGCIIAAEEMKPEFHLGTTTGIWKKLPEATKFIMYPLLASMFFTRPNLDPEKKKYDLVVPGITSKGGTYRGRWLLRQQLEKLTRFKIDFADWAGYFRATHWGPVRGNYQGRNRPYLNAWSEHLGSGRFVTFGGTGGYLLGKYGECLGSGAIPILPYCPDLEWFGIEPMVHYIPQEGMINDNARVSHCLEKYDRYRYIAENAVQWHTDNVDQMLFEGFENVVREATSYRYPKRIVRG